MIIHAEMAVKIYSSAVYGVSARTITFEFEITSVNETKDMPEDGNVHSPKAGINVSIVGKHPDILLDKAAYSLPNMIGLLVTTGDIQSKSLDEYVIIGGLDGGNNVLSIKGALAIATQVRKEKFKRLILPYHNAREAAIVNNLEVYGVQNLRQVLDLLNGKSDVQPTIVNTREEFAEQYNQYSVDFADIKGYEKAKRALEIAAAGGHNALLIGSPNAPKVALAERLSTILPPITLQEAFETTKAHSGWRYTS